MTWTVRVQYGVHDGTTADWEHTFDRRPSAQLFPDRRARVGCGDFLTYFSNVDWIERIPPTQKENTPDGQ